MTNKPKRVGRPTTEGREGEKSTLGIRASAALKDRLQEAADRNGRSLSAEAEVRLERSFSDGDLVSRLDDLHLGRDVVGFLMLAERAMTDTGNMVATMHGKRREGWLNDPYAYDQAVKALLEVVEMLRPQGQMPKLGEVVEGQKVEGKEAGLITAGLINDVAGDAPKWPRSEWGAAVHDRLGRIAERMPAFKPVKQKGPKL